MHRKQIFLALGSNLGDRQQNLEAAMAALEEQGIGILARSSIYETEPRDVVDQPWFLNMVVECETNLLPRQLLALTQQIERDLGRTRKGVPPRGPRSIDIDILLFGNTKIATDELQIPHPRMCQRRFVLEPLLEIAPDLRHPASHERLETYLLRVRDQRLKRR